MNDEGLIGNLGSSANVTGPGRFNAGKSSPHGRGIGLGKGGGGPDRGPARADQGVRGKERPKPRICVIDPEEELLLDLESVLHAMGYEVLSLNRVIGASNEIRAFSPDLLIVDIQMPAVSGGKLIEVLRRNLPDMPLLILYSRLQEPDLARLARALRADDFIIKSGNLLSLVNRVKFHLNLLGRQKGMGVAAADHSVLPRLNKGRGQ
ncbi:MAG TPA: response regulator [bacterium]|nr:response regulator [bacterium]